MSKRDRFGGVGTGLGAALDKLEAEKRDEKVELKTAPGKLMAFSQEMIDYKARIASLEVELADSQKSEIPLTLIDPNPWQPRTYFDPVELQELADSIAEIGLVHPIVVRRAPIEKSVSNSDTSSATESATIRDTRYQVVAGECRLRAHKLLGKETIRAFVITALDDELALMALAENIRRQDLSDYEISLGIRRVEAEFKSRTKLAEALGLARAELYRYLAYESLPGFVKASLDKTPRLLGSNTVGLLVTLLKSHGDSAETALLSLWPKFEAGSIDQTKLPVLITTILSKTAPHSFRDVRKLFLDKEQAGTITIDKSSIIVKLKLGVLTNDQTSRLQGFVEDLLKESVSNKDV